jgi:hypothetical protein
MSEAHHTIKRDKLKASRGNHTAGVESAVAAVYWFHAP